MMPDSAEYCYSWPNLAWEETKGVLKCDTKPRFMHWYHYGFIVCRGHAVVWGANCWRWLCMVWVPKLLYGLLYYGHSIEWHCGKTTHCPQTCNKKNLGQRFDGIKRRVTNGLVDELSVGNRLGVIHLMFFFCSFCCLVFLAGGLLGSKERLSHKKKRPDFPLNPGCLV